MRVYKPRRLHPLHMVALSLRGAGTMMRLAPLILLIACFLAPVAPHLRWQYSYVGSYRYKRIVSCDYVGLRGFVHVEGNCPLVAFVPYR